MKTTTERAVLRNRLATRNGYGPPLFTLNVSSILKHPLLQCKYFFENGRIWMQAGGGGRAGVGGELWNGCPLRHSDRSGQGVRGSEDGFFGVSCGGFCSRSPLRAHPDRPCPPVVACTHFHSSLPSATRVPRPLPAPKFWGSRAAE